MGLFDKNENNMSNVITKLKKDYPSFNFIYIKQDEDQILENSVLIVYNVNVFIHVVEKIVANLQISDNKIFYSDNYLLFTYFGEKSIKSIVCEIR